MATGLVTPVKIGIVTFKDQGQTLSSRIVELEIKILVELSETVETDHFTETARHVS